MAQNLISLCTSLSWNRRQTSTTWPPNVLFNWIRLEKSAVLNLANSRDIYRQNLRMRQSQLIKLTQRILRPKKTLIRMLPRHVSKTLKCMVFKGRRHSVSPHTAYCTKRQRLYRHKSIWERRLLLPRLFYHLILWCRFVKAQILTRIDAIRLAPMSRVAHSGCSWVAAAELNT